MPHPAAASQGATRRAERALRRVPVEDIRPNPLGPRRLFSRASVDALAESIRLHGQLSPLLVRANPAGRGWQLIAGARRLMALKRLGRPWAEVIALEAGDCACGLMALVENLQREPLHYLDVAAACRQLLDAQPITQERLATGLGMSPSALNNRLRLLKLPESVQAALRQSPLTERHARALLRLGDPAAQLSLVAQAAEQGMSVKRLEARVDALLAAADPPLRAVAGLARDNRLVINAVLSTVRELARIGVPVKSRVEERDDRVEVIVTIPARQASPADGQRRDPYQPPRRRAADSP